MRLAFRRFLYILRVQFTHNPPPFPMPPKHRAERGEVTDFEKTYRRDEDWNFYLISAGCPTPLAVPDPSSDMSLYPLFPEVADLPPKSDTDYWRDAPKEWIPPNNPTRYEKR